MVVLVYKCRFCILKELFLVEACGGMTSNLSVIYFNIMQTLKSFMFTWVYNVIDRLAVTAKSIQEWKIPKITSEVFPSAKGSGLQAFKYSWIEIN